MPSATTTTYTYDPTFNQMLSMTDPQGRVTTYTIDAHGNRLSETDPLGGDRTLDIRFPRQCFDIITDKDGNTTTYTYDAYGNLITADRAARTKLPIHLRHHGQQDVDDRCRRQPHEVPI